MTTIEALLKLTRRVGANQIDDHDTRLVVQDLFAIALKERFSEEWYLETYPDVRAAVDADEVRSGLRHFVESGVHEGRMPFPVQINERHYASTHLDVSRSVVGKTYNSCSDHFHKIGFWEGREVVFT